MAFVCRAERTMDYISRHGTELGPGSYMGQEPPKQAHAFAPFSSTTERDLNPGVLYTPGPGSYSATNLMSSGIIPGGRGASIDHFGREKLYGPFASRDERFKAKKAEPVPGPGTYDTGANWNKAKKTPVKQEWNSMNWLRLPSAPSIPAPNQAFGYDETPAGELVMQKNPEKMYEGTYKDSVGPGHYNARKADEVWRTRGTAWHKSKAKRLATSAPGTTEKVGPGSYNEFQINLAPMYKFRPNAVFASGTKRTTSIPAGKRKEPEDSEDEEEDIAEVAPGPGHYDVLRQATGFKTKPVPERLQFFGSTSARFDRKPPLNPGVGPGTYGDLRKPLVPKKVSEGKVPFSTKDIRFQARPDTNPGPGSYKEPHFTEDTKRRAWGRQGVFGTTEKRFVGTIPTTAGPGPGYYPPDAHKRVGIHNSVNRKQLSVFASKTGRSADLKPDGPAPGQYELPSTFNEKRITSGTGNPLLAGVGDHKKREAAFNIKSQRFTQPLSEMQEKLGPGTYDPKLAKDMQSHKPVFIPKVTDSQASRFGQKGKDGNPGPGSYFDEQGNGWTKRSYNILFTEYV